MQQHTRRSRRPAHMPSRKVRDVRSYERTPRIRPTMGLVQREYPWHHASSSGRYRMPGIRGRLAVLPAARAKPPTDVNAHFHLGGPVFRDTTISSGYEHTELTFVFDRDHDHAAQPFAARAGEPPTARPRLNPIPRRQDLTSLPRNRLRSATFSRQLSSGELRRRKCLVRAP